MAYFSLNSLFQYEMLVLTGKFDDGRVCVQISGRNFLSVVWTLTFIISTWLNLPYEHCKLWIISHMCILQTFHWIQMHLNENCVQFPQNNDVLPNATAISMFEPISNDRKWSKIQITPLWQLITTEQCR